MGLYTNQFFLRYQYAIRKICKHNVIRIYTPSRVLYTVILQQYPFVKNKV